MDRLHCVFMFTLHSMDKAQAEVCVGWWGGGGCARDTIAETSKI